MKKVADGWHDEDHSELAGIIAEWVAEKYSLDENEVLDAIEQWPENVAPVHFEVKEGELHAEGDGTGWYHCVLGQEPVVVWKKVTKVSDSLESVILNYKSEANKRFESSPAKGGYIVSQFKKNGKHYNTKLSGSPKDAYALDNFICFVGGPSLFEFDGNELHKELTRKGYEYCGHHITPNNQEYCKWYQKPKGSDVTDITYIVEES